MTAVTVAETENTVLTAASWLRDLLGSGPVLAGDVRRAAESAGIDRAALSRAASEVGVVRSEHAARATWWALPGHADLGGGERRCTKCAEVKPIDAFSRYRGSRMHVCIACESARKRTFERMATDPECVPAVNRAVAGAPDPEPARLLRRELERQRTAGRPWRSAWVNAQAVALRGLPPAEQADWRRVFSATHEHWAASYSRAPWPTHRRPALFVGDSQAA